MKNIEDCERDVQPKKTGNEFCFWLGFNVNKKFSIESKHIKDFLNKYIIPMVATIGVNNYMFYSKIDKYSDIYQNRIPEMSNKEEIINIPNSNISNESINDDNLLKTPVISKAPKVAVIQFAEDDVYSEGSASICHSSNFLGKRVMLSNLDSLENDTVVTLSESMDCSLIGKPQACEGDLIIHIRFATARKLYSGFYNPEENIDKLPSCSYATVTSLD